MHITAKSSVFCDPKELREYLITQCPIKVFKHIVLENHPEHGLSFAYKVPSKIRMKVMLTSPVTDDFLNYLIDNEFRIQGVGEQRFMLNSIRDLQMQANKGLKEFSSSLSREKIERFGGRIQQLCDMVNKQCIPTHFTDGALQQWDNIRNEMYKRMKRVTL